MLEGGKAAQDGDPLFNHLMRQKVSRSEHGGNRSEASIGTRLMKGTTPRRGRFPIITTLAQNKL